MLEHERFGPYLERLMDIVGITGNNIAYLKRQIEEPDPDVASYKGRTSSAADIHANGDVDETRNGHEVKVKYRDPVTNETWSRRGRMANWLKRKRDAGEDIEKYLVS